MDDVVDNGAYASRARAGREALRLTDADRRAAVQRLDDAIADGRLDLTEYEARVQTAYAARTHGDLLPIMSDLEPAADVVAVRSSSLLVKLWVAWAAIVALNVAVWAMLTIAVGGGIHPWPVWVAIPPGVALLGVTAVVKAGRRRL